MGTHNDTTIKLDETIKGLKTDSESVSLSLESQQSLIKKCCDKIENLETKTPDILDIEKNYRFKRRFIILSILAGLSLVVSAVNLCLDVFFK